MLFASCTSSTVVSPGAGGGIHASELLHDASGLPLVYVSNPRGSNVTVYSYRDAKHVRLVQTITGMSTPYGSCVDRKQNVYVADGVTDDIVEFAHGGTTPIGTLADTHGMPFACAINPANGDLAVVNNWGPSGSDGNVLVYSKAKGDPTSYSDPNLEIPEQAAYDDDGNLFVDGSKGPSRPFVLFELQKGKKIFSYLKVRGAQIREPSGLQWCAPHMLLADSDYQSESTTLLYVLKVAASRTQVVRKVALASSGNVEQFWKQGQNVIAPDGDSVPIFSYRTGNREGEITKGVFAPVAAVVSAP
ncbi:MAG TPA: hypothetical protein VGF86_15925 [Candidatus Tumulicola sp.]